MIWGIRQKGRSIDRLGGIMYCGPVLGRRERADVCGPPFLLSVGRYPNYFLVISYLPSLSIWMSALR